MKKKFVEKKLKISLKDFEDDEKQAKESELGITNDPSIINKKKKKYNSGDYSI